MRRVDDGVTEEERKLNRTLGVSAVACGAAALGSAGLPALSITSAGVALVIYVPSAVHYLRESWRRRRLLYRGVRALAMSRSLRRRHQDRLVLYELRPAPAATEKKRAIIQAMEALAEPRADGRTYLREPIGVFVLTYKA